VVYAVQKSDGVIGRGRSGRDSKQTAEGGEQKKKQSDRTGGCGGGCSEAHATNDVGGYGWERTKGKSEGRRRRRANTIRTRRGRRGAANTNTENLPENISEDNKPIKEARTWKKRRQGKYWLGEKLEG